MQAARHHKIYIVDDDDAVRDSLRALLKLFDFEVRDFSSAKEFLAERAEARNACLLLDLHMPVMGGIELLAQMKADGSRLPAIVMTGRNDPLLKQRALQSGAFALLACFRARIAGRDRSRHSIARHSATRRVIAVQSASRAPAISNVPASRNRSTASGTRGAA